MSVADKLGLGPKRESRQLPTGDYIVRVTPPDWTGCSPSEVKLTANQFVNFQRWLNGSILIQDAFPDLSDDDREILKTGIGPKEWADKIGDD